MEKKCAECGHELTYMDTWDGDIMLACDECGSAYRYIIDRDKLERYFFG